MQCRLLNERRRKHALKNGGRKEMSIQIKRQKDTFIYDHLLHTWVVDRQNPLLGYFSERLLQHGNAMTHQERYKR